jgi:hypothetical protein
MQTVKRSYGVGLAFEYCFVSVHVSAIRMCFVFTDEVNMVAVP